MKKGVPPFGTGGPPRAGGGPTGKEQWNYLFFFIWSYLNFNELNLLNFKNFIQGYFGDY